MSDETIMITTFTFLDPVLESFQQMEALLSNQADGTRSPFEAALAELISAGGKRLRPRMALLVGGALEAEEEPLLNLAAAVEMLHTASLIHDDLVDGSSLRRGTVTLNARWPAAASVLVGDLAFTRAAGLIHATRSFPAIEMFTRTIAVMVESEVAQLARPAGRYLREDYFQRTGAKTAALFELAAGAPALLSRAGAEIVATARRFGYGVGMAFQIVDDVLDLTGDPNRLGKPTGNDLRQGVVTLPALNYLEDHPGDADLRAILRRERPAEATLGDLVRRICRSAAIDRALETASGFIREALEDLACLPECPQRFALAKLALDITEREL
jgi:geranylgeranyl pyrophosphate synthase